MGYFDSIYAANLLHRSVAVYMYLKERSNGDGNCWPGINTIAAQLGYSRSTVKRALHELYDHGWVEAVPRHRENGSSSSNAYKIIR